MQNDSLSRDDGLTLVLEPRAVANRRLVRALKTTIVSSLPGSPPRCGPARRVDAEHEGVPCRSGVVSTARPSLRYFRSAGGCGRASARRARRTPLPTPHRHEVALAPARRRANSRSASSVRANRSRQSRVGWSSLAPLRSPGGPRARASRDGASSKRPRSRHGAPRGRGQNRVRPREDGSSTSSARRARRPGSSRALPPSSGR